MSNWKFVLHNREMSTESEHYKLKCNMKLEPNETISINIDNSIMDESSEMIYNKEIYYSTDIIKAFLKNEKEEVWITTNYVHIMYYLLQNVFFKRQILHVFIF